MKANKIKLRKVFNRKLRKFVSNTYAPPFTSGRVNDDARPSSYDDVRAVIGAPNPSTGLGSEGQWIPFSPCGRRWRI